MTSHCSTFPLYVIPHLQSWQLQLPVTLLQKGKCFEMMNYISVGEPQTSIHLSLAIIPLWLLLSPLTHSPGFILFSSPKGIPGLPCPTLPHQRVPQPHIRAHQVRKFGQISTFSKISFIPDSFISSPVVYDLISWTKNILLNSSVIILPIKKSDYKTISWKHFFSLTLCAPGGGSKRLTA